MHLTFVTTIDHTSYTQRTKAFTHNLTQPCWLGNHNWVFQTHLLQGQNPLGHNLVFSLRPRGSCGVPKRGGLLPKVDQEETTGFLGGENDVSSLIFIVNFTQMRFEII